MKYKLFNTQTRREIIEEKKKYKWLIFYNQFFKEKKRFWFPYMKIRKKKGLLFKHFSVPGPFLKDLNNNLILKREKLRKYKYLYKFISLTYKYMLRLKKKKKRKRRGFRFIFNTRSQLKIFRKTKDFFSISKQIDNYLLKDNLLKEKRDFYWNYKKKKLRKHFKWFFRKNYNFEQTLLFNKFKIIKYMFKEKKKLMYKERKLVNCILTLKKTNNNFFIIISDMKNKVLAYRWAGQLNETHNVKNKRSFFLIFPLARYVIKILKKFNISRLSIRILSNVTSNMYKLVQLIQDSNIKIDRIYFRKPVPHHLGKKKKKLRRI